MTVQEYMNPQMFPLTSQEGLTPEKQIQLDSLNFDEYQKAKRAHEPMNEHERRVGYELECKHAVRGSVLRALQGGEDDGPQGPDGKPLM